MVGFGWTVTGVVVSGTVIVAVGIVVTVTFTTWGGSVGAVIFGVGVLVDPVLVHPATITPPMQIIRNNKITFLCTPL